MKELFIPVKIDNLDKIQEELKQMLGSDYQSKGKHAFNITLNTVKSSCPCLSTWLLPKLKSYPRLLRFYITPPKSFLGVHIDGRKNMPSPFGLNIPVFGCENTYHIFYNCDQDNIEDGDDERYLEGAVPKKIDMLTELERKEITAPCFVRNDIMHSVENNQDTWRVMFTIRWQIHSTFGKVINDVFDIEKCL